jgi:CHRD domain-containing protein
MSARLMLAVSLTLSPAVLAGCTQEAPTASESTVQLAVVAGADHGGRPFAESMTQEVTNTPVYAGDPDGTGTALITINVGLGEVCWHMTVSNIALPATAAHIHNAAEGIRGAIVIALTAPDATGEAVGCRSDVDPVLLRDILQYPEEYYVNVHSTEFPPGAIRSQLER